MTGTPEPRGGPVAVARGTEPLIRVLSLVHNHPHFRPGGAEIHALDLHRAMKASSRFEPLLLAATVDDFGGGSGRELFRVRPEDPTELLWSVGEFDHFYFTARDKTSYTGHFRRLLQDFRPHVVHVQHLQGLGLEALAEIRRTCPGAPIVYTLHEFLPICYSRGLMLRHGTGERCTGASPWRCHQCFPERSPEDFFLREKFIKALLQRVDLFIAPSRSLMSRYVDWGLPADRIRFQDYGRQQPPRMSAEGSLPSVDTRRFVFLGQAMRHKGVLVLLRAIRLLIRRGSANLSLAICGGNMECDGDDYVREVSEAQEELDGRVELRGRYESEEVAALLEGAGWVVVPSIWWENSPLVIQEAFMHRRPVICSDIGGMAEKVCHEVNGLHFRAGDAAALADALEKAAGNDELWLRLCRGIPAIYTLQQSLRELEAMYRELLDTKAHAVPPS